MENTCEFCKTTFKSSSNLLNHKRNAKYCLTIRNKDNNNFNCTYCSKNFSSKNWLDIHLTKCTGYSKNLKEEMLKHKSDNDTLLKKINIMEETKQFLEKQLQEKDKQYEKQLQEKDKQYEKQLQEKDKQIADLQNKLENIAIKAATKPTHVQNNNQRINQIVNNLIPITQEHLKEQAEYLTLDHIKNGASGYVQYALDYPLKDRVACTDYSRKKIKYKDEKGNIIDDPEMTKLTEKLFKVIKEKNTFLIDGYMDEIQRKNTSTIANTGNELNDEETENFYYSLDFLIDELLKYKHLKNDLIDTSEGRRSELYYDFTKDICSKLCK